jgi:hypothetical protein
VRADKAALRRPPWPSGQNSKLRRPNSTRRFRAYTRTEVERRAFVPISLAVGQSAHFLNSAAPKTTASNRLRPARAAAKRRRTCRPYFRDQ